MECPTVETLSAYLDGELGRREAARIEKHLVGCESCSESLRTLREAGETLRGELASGRAEGEGRGGDCPDEGRLGAYLERSLRPRESAALEAHLIACPLCRGKLVSASEALSARPAGAEVPERLLRRARGLVRPAAERLFDLVLSLKENALSVVRTTAGSLQLLGSGAAGALEPLPVRGDGEAAEGAGKIEGVVIRRREEGIDFKLEVINVGGEKCRVRLALRDPESLVPLPRLRVDLCEGRRILQSQPTGRGGEVAMEDVPPGSYLLRVNAAREWEIPLSLVREEGGP